MIWAILSSAAAVGGLTYLAVSALLPERRERCTRLLPGTPDLRCIEDAGHDCPHMFEIPP